ncbi:hypothetical protein ELP33_25110 [Klebsiella quasipneumoniae]|nr:hypothetical protein [Klebsiella quasipneumoniae]MBM5563600.1 hypothetical protein [Klebsiella quasipneumoniae]QSI14163.1 hypothetical protein FA956_21535 [Klebsiella quasipneumoniae]
MQAQRRRAMTAGTKPPLCRMAAHALSGLQRLNPQKHLSAPLFQPPAQYVGPRKRSAAGQRPPARSRLYAGWRLTPYPADNN